MQDQNPIITLNLSLNDVQNLIAVIEGFLEHAPKRPLEETHYISGLGLRIRGMALEALNTPQGESIPNEEAKTIPMSRKEKEAIKNGGNHATEKSS